MKKVLFFSIIVSCLAWISCDKVENSCDEFSFNGSYAEVNGVYYCPSHIGGGLTLAQTNNHNREELNVVMTTSGESGCLNNLCTELSLTIRTPWPNVSQVQIPDSFSGTLAALSETGLILHITQKMTDGKPEIILIDPYVRSEDVHIDFLVGRANRSVNYCRINGTVGYGAGDQTANIDCYLSPWK